MIAPTRREPKRAAAPTMSTRRLRDTGERDLIQEVADGFPPSRRSSTRG